MNKYPSYNPTVVPMIVVIYDDCLPCVSNYGNLEDITVIANGTVIIIMTRYSHKPPFVMQIPSLYQ